VEGFVSSVAAFFEFFFVASPRLPRARRLRRRFRGFTGEEDSPRFKSFSSPTRRFLMFAFPRPKVSILLSVV
jgi:hypothetical protein